MATISSPIHSSTYSPTPTIPISSKRMDLDLLLSKVMALLQAYVREYRDTLKLLEISSHENWQKSTNEQISNMRSWTNHAMKIGGVALAIAGTIPQVHPSGVERALNSLRDRGITPDLASQFQGQPGKLAKAVSSVVSFAQKAHEQADNMNATRLEANKTEYAAQAEKHRDFHSKFSSALHDESKTANDLLNTMESVQKSLEETKRTIARST